MELEKARSKLLQKDMPCTVNEIQRYMICYKYLFCDNMPGGKFRFACAFYK